MGLFDGWPFKTREQEEKEKKDFEKRVFHLGIEQREAARAVIKEGTSAKLKDKEGLFAFICVKDAYTQGEEDNNGPEFAQNAMKKQKWIKKDDMKFIYALVCLDVRTSSLETYPTAEDVHEYMEQDEWCLAL